MHIRNAYVASGSSFLAGLTRRAIAGKRSRTSARQPPRLRRNREPRVVVVVADAPPHTGDDVAARIAARLAHPVAMGALELVVPAVLGTASVQLADLPRDVLERAQLAAVTRSVAPAAPEDHAPLSVLRPSLGRAVLQQG